MNRYWISWYSGYYVDEGCTTPPFQCWITGSMQRPDDGLNPEMYGKYQALRMADEDQADDFLVMHSRDTAAICAMVDAETEGEVWEVIGKHFPDYRQRFIEPCEPDQIPGDRFGNFENRTSLYE